MMRQLRKQENEQAESLAHRGEAFWEKPILITHHIFWMSFCDMILSLWAIILWGPKLFDVQLLQLSPISCSIGGIIVQFGATGSVVWYFVIAWCLFSTIFGLDLLEKSPNRSELYHSIFAWSIICIVMIIPAIDNEYGCYDNLRNKDSECWVRDPLYYLTLYIPVLIVVSFAIFLLLCVWLRFYLCSNHRRQGISIHDSVIISRLTLFTIVFILAWIWPLCDRMYSVISGNSAPYWLTVLHHWALGLIGCANALCWSRSKHFQSFGKSYHIMSQNKQHKTRLELQNELWSVSSM